MPVALLQLTKNLTCQCVVKDYVWVIPLVITLLCVAGCVYKCCFKSDTTTVVVAGGDQGGSGLSNVVQQQQLQMQQMQMQMQMQAMQQVLL